MTHRTFRHRVSGFTIIELLVVVSIIVLLLAILLPSMSEARRVSRIAVCAAHLKQINTGTYSYTTDNVGVLWICRGRQVQIAVNHLGVKNHNNRDDDKLVDWPRAMASAGLAYNLNEDVATGVERRPNPVWNCPERDGFNAAWFTYNDQMILGYQYFGGIETWTTVSGNYPSRSPVVVQKSRPGWLLASDRTMRINGKWESGFDDGVWYEGIPNHLDRRWNGPAGGNQTYMDGSVSWVDFKDMVRIHSWANGSREAWGWQSDWGLYNPPVNNEFPY
ncbi:MAG: prepilin-type N-terminal cleavage/methylation domain-containing protein [Phycisphaera sp.]|nr:prepilin-type N-terminal cleavage/methylation domain-containing protein [Phycisphaera sp.]